MSLKSQKICFTGLAIKDGRSYCLRPTICWGFRWFWNPPGRLLLFVNI